MISFQYTKKIQLRAAVLVALLCLIFAVPSYAALPEHIAVLPIQGDGTPEDLQELRVTYFNHIGYKNYRDMELEDVDSKLFLLEQQTGKKWRELPHKQVADHLGVQGLMFLDVIGIEKLYAGFYGSLTIKLGVTFIEAETGRIIWQKENTVSRKSGGIPLSPWAAISTAVQSAMVLRDSVKIELFDKLCRTIAKELPEPATLTVERPPTIFSVVTNTLDSPFKAHDEILVSLKGDEGMKAYFSIVGQTDAVSLNELKPGEYLGKYVVPEGANYEGQLMEVFLVNSEKRKVSKYQVPYLVTVDTIPPGEVTDFSAGISEKGFKLSWNKPADDDIKEFAIKRALEGETEYTDLAATELNEYMDETVPFGQKIFYKIFTKDRADNLSKPVELTRFAVQPGPTNVTGELKENTVFYSYGSPYIVSEKLIVPKGVRLTIEAGTVIRFEDGASMQVLGSIESLGTHDNGVTFKGKGYSLVLQDAGARGGVFQHTTFRNGSMMEVLNSGAFYDSCRFESFDVAIKSSQNSALELDKCVFGYNKTALLNESGFVEIEETEFANNSEALSFLTDTKADIKDLVLKNNVLDITTEGDILIDRADIADKESFEILRSLRGPISINNILPYRKSLKLLKEDSDGDLLKKLAVSLIDENFEEAEKLFSLVKELFPSRYEQTKIVHGYVLFKLGRQTEGRELIDGSNADYKQGVAEVLGLAERTGPPVKMRFVAVRIPVIGSGEGLGKIALSKAVKQSVKEHVESITGKLPREKSFIVKGKILSDSEKYATGVFPVGTRVSGTKFEGLYVVFLNVGTVLADLQDLSIIGNRKRELKVGLASCGGGDEVRPALAKELNTLLFPVVELPSKGCTFVEYKEDIAMNKLDMLVIAREEANASKSRVSNNLKMINADMTITVFNAQNGSQVYEDSKGVVVYHMNESMGTKAAMKQAYDAIGQGVVDKLVAIERKLAPAPVIDLTKPNAQKPAAKPKGNSAEAAKQQSKRSEPPTSADKGITLSVAGVEPVFANMPDAFVNRPFMTLVIENESSESITQSELTLDVPGYFTAPIAAELESIPALDRVRLQLFAEFTDSLSKVSKTKKAEAVITIKYGRKKTEIKYPVVIFDAHTTRWNTGDKLAIYIDEELAGVKAIAEGVAAEADRLSEQKHMKGLYAGMAAFEYLGGIGIKFVPDEKRPFTSVYGSNTKVDSAGYPAEILKAKSGDADDMMIIYASVLKAAGIDMGYAVVGDKAVALFDTRIPEEMIGSMAFPKEKIVIYDENIWVPMDVSMMADGAAQAWESGAKIAASMGEDSTLTVLSKAEKKYKPVRLYRSDIKTVPVSTFQAKYDELKTLFSK